EVARGRSVLPGPSELELCLSYAAAFGLSPPLLKRQEKRDGYAQPAWFQAIPTADSSDSTSIMAFLYSCETTASSDGGTGGPAGGASGGGASGAGEDRVVDPEEAWPHEWGHGSLKGYATGTTRGP